MVDFVEFVAARRESLWRTASSAWRGHIELDEGRSLPPVWQWC